MKKFIIIVNLVFPVFVCLFLLAMLSFFKDLYSRFYAQMYEQVSLPPPQQFLLGDSYGTIFILAFLFIVTISAILIPRFFKNERALTAAYSIYHAVVLSGVVLIFGSHMIAFAIPLLDPALYVNKL